MDINRLCLGCMKEKAFGIDICPNCGQSMSTLKNSSRELPVGSILDGRYLVGKRIGGGGFGIIYLGFDSDENCVVAIKELFPGNLAERNVLVSDSNDILLKDQSQKTLFHFSKAKDGFILEGCNLQNCKDIEGIVHVSRFFEENNTVYLIMDHIEGYSLAKDLNFYGGKYDEAHALSIIKPVMATLHELHRHHLIHRDITPENIMINHTTDKPVLIDFGSARYAGLSEGERHTVLVTRGYAPPEQYTSIGKQGPWSDVYSLCATLLALLTGSDTPAADPLVTTESIVLKAVSDADIVLSQRTQKVIEKGIEYSYSKRFQSIAEMYEELFGEKISPSEDSGEEISSSDPFDAPPKKIPGGEGFWTTSRIIAASAAGSIVFLIFFTILCLRMI